MAIQPDHVHVLLQAPPKYAPARIVQVMKSISARESFRHFPQLRRQLRKAISLTRIPSSRWRCAIWLRSSSSAARW